MGLGLLDIGIVACVLCFGLIGFVKGFSWQLMGVLTIVLCFTIAHPLSGALEPTVADWIGVSLKAPAGVPATDAQVIEEVADAHYLARAAAWALAFVLIWLFTHLLYFVFREGIERWHMQELNRGLGVIFGVLKGGLLVCAMVVVLATLGVEREGARVRMPSLLARSKVAPTVLRVARIAKFALPDSVELGLARYFEALPTLDNQGVGHIAPPATRGAPPPAKAGKATTPPAEKTTPPAEKPAAPPAMPPAGDAKPADGKPADSKPAPPPPPPAPPATGGR